MAEKKNNNVKKEKISNRNPHDVLLSGWANGSGYNNSNAYNYAELQQYAENRSDLITYQRFILENLYVSSGLVKRIVDMPIEDAFKQGITIQSEVITSASDLKKLNNWIDRTLLPQFKTAKKFARLFGGSALIICGGFSEEDSKDLQEADLEVGYEFRTKFDLNNLKQGDKIGFEAVSQWELNQAGVLQNPDYSNIPFNPVALNVGKNNQNYNYGSVKVDKSRIVPFIGVKAPSIIRQKLRGWGVSVIESAVTPLQTYYKETKVLFEFIDETKVDVLQINNLVEAVQTEDGIAKLEQLAECIARNKNYKNLLILDEKSNYQAKQLNFDGIKIAYETLETNLASNIGIPKNKLFGDSSSGFSSGNDALENYNTMVQDIQQQSLPELEELIKIGLKTILGLDYEEIKEGLDISFPSLKILSDEEQSIIDDRKFSVVNQLYANGILNAHELKEQVNAMGILPVALDVDSGDERPEPNLPDALVEERDYA